MKVAPDYETLVTSGDQYLKDAEMFNNLMQEFTIKAKDVTISVENINQAIIDIVEKARDSAQGSQDISQGIADTVTAVNEVTQLA